MTVRYLLTSEILIKTDDQKVLDAEMANLERTFLTEVDLGQGG